jgi:hypothetical protein
MGNQASDTPKASSNDNEMHHQENKASSKAATMDSDNKRPSKDEEEAMRRQRYKNQEQFEKRSQDWCKKHFDDKDAWIDGQVAANSTANSRKCLRCTRNDALREEDCDCPKCFRTRLLRYKFGYITEFNWAGCGLSAEDYWQGKKCLESLSQETHDRLNQPPSDDLVFGSKPVLHCRCEKCLKAASLRG